MYICLIIQPTVTLNIFSNVIVVKYSRKKHCVNENWSYVMVASCAPNWGKTLKWHNNVESNLYQLGGSVIINSTA